MEKAAAIDVEKHRATSEEAGRTEARRIFFLLDSLNVGGTESQAVELARRLDPQRYEVTLGCLRARGPLLERLKGSPVRVVEFYPEGGIDSPRGLYQTARLAWFLRRSHFDIFHSQDLWSNLMGIPAAWLAGVPVIISSRRDLGHLDWYRTRKRAWLRRIQRLSDVVVANAESIRDWLIAEEGLSPKKVHVLRNAVDVDNFTRACRSREQLFPGVGEKKLIVLVGNMHSDVKGHSSLINAAPAILRQFPNSLFVLVGDGEQRPRYERECERLSVQRNFLFLGRRTDIPEILACCDLAVLPSQAEGLSNALLEYLAARLPVVASAVGGNGEVIVDGETGLLMPANNEGVLAAAVLRLLRDPALGQRLAGRGQDFVRQNFSYETLLAQTDKLYSELLQQRAATARERIIQWRARVRRIAAMGQHERFVRLKQQIDARADALRHRAKLDFNVDLLPGGAPRLGRFFFSPQDVPALCDLLKQRLPQQAEDIVRRAEKICRHRFDLLGYPDLDYGDPIDWHCDRVHDRRAPRKPWFRIRYLDFAEVGDVKVTWELNRHQHLVTLAKAYRLSGELRFAEELFRQWRHWQAENPYPIGVNWASSLEVAMRSLSWIWIYFLLADSPAMPAGFREEWLALLGISARHIARYLSTYFSPNTHLLGEAVALFFIGTACPELAEAERWQRQGWELVLREANRQVRRDGLHFEQSLYYHVYALDFFLHAAVLAAAADLPIPKPFERTLENMLSALALLSRAGPPPQLGDDDGGRVFDPQRNRSQHMLDPFATGAVLYQRADLKSLAGELREETVWLLGAQGVAEFDRISPQAINGASTILESGGLYLMANSASREQIVIDAGPQGAGSAGHGHADALSLCWNRDGRPLLIDPGTFEYVGRGPERKQFRGTSAHNTLAVDGWSQAGLKGPFAWARLPQVRAEGWVSGRNFDLFVGSHDGYCRLPSPVVHRRWVFWLKPHFLLVRDLALGEGQHHLDVYWHLSPALSYKKEDDVFVSNDGGGLRLLTVEGHGWSRELQAGWWSPVYGRREPAPVLRFSAAATLPAEFVTLAMPVAASAREEDRLTRLGESSATVSGYRFLAAEGEHYIFFAKPGQVWTLGPWTSDAEFLYWGRSDQRSLFISCNATYVEASGKKLLTCTKPVLRCEIAAAGDEVQVIASSDEVLVSRNALPREFKPAATTT